MADHVVRAGALRRMVHLKSAAEGGGGGNVASVYQRPATPNTIFQ